MARLHFKRQLKIDGKIYKRGTQNVPDEKLEHKHFALFQKAGLISAPPEKKKLPRREEPELAKVIRKQLAEAAAARKAAADKLAAEQAEADAATDESEDEDLDESEDSEDYQPIVGDDVPPVVADQSAVQKPLTKKERKEAARKAAAAQV